MFRRPHNGIYHVSRPTDLKAARQHVVDFATTAGLPPDRAQALALAVSEIATNAIMHGGGHATLLCYAAESTVILDIHDHGDRPASIPDTARPEPTALGGRGLWIARNVCDSLHVITTASGTIIRLIMNLGAGDGPPGRLPAS